MCTREWIMGAQYGKCEPFTLAKPFTREQTLIPHMGFVTNSGYNITNMFTVLNIQMSMVASMCGT